MLRTKRPRTTDHGTVEASETIEQVKANLARPEPQPADSVQLRWQPEVAPAKPKPKTSHKKKKTTRPRSHVTTSRRPSAGQFFAAATYRSLFVPLTAAAPKPWTAPAVPLPAKEVEEEGEEAPSATVLRATAQRLPVRMRQDAWLVGPTVTHPHFRFVGRATNTLTSNERMTIESCRLEQLSFGAPSLLPPEEARELLNPFDIMAREFELGLLHGNLSTDHRLPIPVHTWPIAELHRQERFSFED